MCLVQLQSHPLRQSVDCCHIITIDIFRSTSLSKLPIPSSRYKALFCQLYARLTTIIQKPRLDIVTGCRKKANAVLSACAHLGLVKHVVCERCDAMRRRLEFHVAVVASTSLPTVFCSLQNEVHMRGNLVSRVRMKELRPKPMAMKCQTTHAAPSLRHQMLQHRLTRACYLPSPHP
jgi:hypothetical protein